MVASSSDVHSRSGPLDACWLTTAVWHAGHGLCSVLPLGKILLKCTVCIIFLHATKATSYACLLWYKQCAWCCKTYLMFLQQRLHHACCCSASNMHGAVHGPSPDATLHRHRVMHLLYCGKTPAAAFPWGQCGRFHSKFYAALICQLCACITTSLQMLLFPDTT